ncbi:glucosamine inositolphosphorylceramide transferase family protein [Caballeronia udeis]|nr:hypothetical protein [Caballeronia udeis]
MLIEQKISKRVSEASLVAIPAQENLHVLYNGKSGIAALWKILMVGATPHIQVVWLSPQDRQICLLSESRVAIPDKLFFCASLHLCIGRRESLLSRARERLKDMSSISAAPQDIVMERGTVSAGNVIGFAVRHLSYRAVRKVSGLFYRKDHWMIAVIDCTNAGNAVDTVRPSWCELPGSADRFRADPFVWRDREGQYHLFFEELSYSENRGVISHVMIDGATHRWTGELQVVLSRPYHLSYPFIFEYEGDMYMIPETSENRTIEVYKACPFPDCWALHKTIMTDVIAADTTLYHDGKTWWMWTSLAREGEPNYDELSVYFAASPFGPWTSHPMNPVVSDCRCARMAGRPFIDKEKKLIRPAQNCEKEYGASLLFCEVIKLTKTIYSERVVGTCTPPTGYQGTHTWNAMGDIAVMDLRRRVHRWIGMDRLGRQIGGTRNEDRDLVLRATGQRWDGDSDTARSRGDDPAGT